MFKCLDLRTSFDHLDDGAFSSSTTGLHRVQPVNLLLRPASVKGLFLSRCGMLSRPRNFVVQWHTLIMFHVIMQFQNDFQTNEVRPNFIDHAGFHFTGLPWDSHWRQIRTPLRCKFMIPNCYSSKLLEKILKLHTDVCAFLVWSLSGKVLKFDSSYRTVKNDFHLSESAFFTRYSSWMNRQTSINFSHSAVISWIEVSLNCHLRVDVWIGPTK